MVDGNNVEPGVFVDDRNVEPTPFVDGENVEKKVEKNTEKTKNNKTDDSLTPET